MPNLLPDNALNAYEYFRLAALQDGAVPDPRMSEAIGIVRAARQSDGGWLQTGRQPGRMWFEVDVPGGQPSNWLTLYGTRLPALWDSAR